ncbi:hypothetical protein ACP275_05G086800 [Erythranthe tilingii]
METHFLYTWSAFHNYFSVMLICLIALFLFIFMNVRLFRYVSSRKEMRNVSSNNKDGIVWINCINYLEDNKQKICCTQCKETDYRSRFQIDTEYYQFDDVFSHGWICTLCAIELANFYPLKYDM